MITNVRPRRDLDPVTYEIIWNGTHRGCDADLLNDESRVPEKRIEDPSLRADYFRRVLATSISADKRARAQAALDRMTRP